MHCVSAQSFALLAGASGASNDPNYMERLRGEMDEQYIAHQTQLFEEARKRMTAKFGTGGIGGGGSMCGKRVMGRLGSSPYPSQGGGSFNSQNTKSVVKDMSSMGMGLWSSFSSAAKDVPTSLSLDSSGLGLGDDDGLISLQQQMQIAKFKK